MVSSTNTASLHNIIYIRSLFLGFFFFCYSTVLPLPLAFATTAPEQTFPDLVHRAEVIAVGTVTDVVEHWDAQAQIPFSPVTFGQLTVLKGRPGDATMTLVFFGGHTPAGALVAISGVPQFTKGEKNVIFSAGNQRDFCPLVGVWQGRLQVRLDPQRNEEVIFDNFDAPIIGVREHRLLKSPSATPSQAPLSLSAFLTLIEQEMQAPYDRP